MNRHVNLNPAGLLASSGSIGPDDLVMPGHNHILARVGDDVWDLSDADHHDGREASVVTISFEYIVSPSLKWAAKELAYHRLNTRLSGEVPTVSAYTCAREQIRLKRFICWLQEFHPEVTSPRAITQAMVHAYHVWLKVPRRGEDQALRNGGGSNETGATAETVWAYMSPIRSLDLYAEVLSEPLTFSPYGGKLSSSFCGVNTARVENSTPVIPDGALHPLITVAMRYVEQYHYDIEKMALDVVAFWQRVDLQGHYTPWPGWTAKIGNCASLNRPWRPELGSADHHVNHEFRAEMSHLLAACCAIILYLSGMRPGELQSLKVGSLRTVKDPITGEVVRWKISGIPLKKRRNKRKKRDALKLVDWVVPEAAAKAVLVLERVLQPFRDRHGCDNLILNLDAFQPYPERSRRGHLSVKQRGLQGFFSSFMKMIQHRFEMPVEGGVTPSQFRRTLARHIARQPFGVIAGKLQYHHVKTAVFEGYAGSKLDGFRDEVADEELEAHIDLLQEIEADAAQGVLLGPGAKVLLQEIGNAKKTIVGEALTDTSAGESALRTALKNLARRIHVAFLNFCVFNPEKAFCLTESEAAQADAQPKVNQCAPDRCANSVLGSCHAPLWQGLLDEVEALKKDARSPHQKASLGDQAARYRKVLAPQKLQVTHGAE